MRAAVALACIGFGVLSGCAETVPGKPLAAETSTPKAQPSVGGAPSAPRPQPPVAVYYLPKLLLDAGEINAAMGASEMVVVDRRRTMWDDRDFVERSCLAVSGPAQQEAYAASGWSAARIETLRQREDDYSHYAVQAVVSFPAARDAAAFYTRSVRTWRDCADRQYRQDVPDLDPPFGIWSVSSVSEHAGVMSVLKTQEGGDGWACQHALTTLRNVAIDSLSCGYGPNQGASQIVTRIADKLPEK